MGACRRNNPAMTTTLILIRHAQTAWNREGRIQGSKDSELSEHGRAQAMLLWRRLAKMKFSAVYSSDHQRCLQTARMALGQTELPIVAVPELRERTLGQWEGRLWSEIVHETPEDARAYRASAQFAPRGGERWAELQSRVFKVIRRVLAERPNQTSVLFTSGGPVRAAVMEAMRIPQDTWAGWATSNTGLTILENLDERWRVIRFNDTGHLDSAS